MAINENGLTNGTGHQKTDRQNRDLAARLRYGFEKNHCVEALEVSKGDVGLALEMLLSQYFRIPVTFSSDVLPPSATGKSELNSDPLTPEDAEYIATQRAEEKSSLESIYEGSFKERVVNRVWVLELQLDYLHRSGYSSDSPGSDTITGEAATLVYFSRSPGKGHVSGNTRLFSGARNTTACKDQWSPFNPDSKKKYDRDFLIKIKDTTEAKKKPEICSDILNFLLKDKVNRRHSQQDRRRRTSPPHSAAS